MVFKVFLFLDKEDVIETFEILCALPYVQSSTFDNEPPKEREHGIESLIEQLERYYNELVQ